MNASVSPPGARALAAARLAGFLGVSVAYAGRCAAISAVRGYDPKFSADHTQRWARRLAQVLGLSVTVRGQLPCHGSILVANHRSYADVGALLAATQCAFLAKAELASWPVMGWCAKIGNTVFVQRDDPVSRKASRQQLHDLAHQGISVVIFPEGTTSPPGQLLPFRPGIFATAAESGLDVVPVALEYSDPGDAWIGDETFVQHFLNQFGRGGKRAVVEFGPVLRGGDAANLRDQAQAWIAGALAQPDFLTRPP